VTTEQQTIQPNPASPTFNPPKGSIVSVPVHTSVGIIEHKAIATGEGTYIHCAKLFNSVIESPLEEYLLTAVDLPWVEGYPGTLPPDEVVSRARSRIGEPWTPISNCEHFVTWAHGVCVQSPQTADKARKGFVWGLVGLIAYTIGRYKR
jgi:hypothetical protein